MKSHDLLKGLTVEDSEDGTGVWEERVKLKVLAQKYFKPYLPYEAKVITADRFVLRVFCHLFPNDMSIK